MGLKANSSKSDLSITVGVGPTLKKPTAAIVVKPTFGKMTAPGRKLLNALLYLTQTQIIEAYEAYEAYEASGNRPLANYGQFVFSGPLTVIGDLTTPEGGSKDGHYGTIQNNIRNLQMVRLEWSSPDANGSTNEDKLIWSSFVLLAGAEICIENGLKILKWSFPHNIIEALISPIRFTVIYMRELSRLRTYCAIALYEICSRYKDNPSGATSVQSTKWWIEALSGDSKISSIKQMQSKVEVDLVSWRTFKQEHLINSIASVNKNTSLTIKVREFKTGKSITHVQFEVLKKNPSQIADITEKKKSRSIEEIKTINRAVSIGLTEFVAGNFIDDYGVESLIATLNRYDGRVLVNDLPAIKNKTRYIKTILEDIAPKKDDSQTSEQKPLAFIAESVIVNTSPIPAVSVYDKYRNIYASLSETDRLRYKSMIEEIFHAKNILTPGLRLRLEKENFGGGVCLAEFKRLIDEGL